MAAERKENREGPRELRVAKFESRGRRKLESAKNWESEGDDGKEKKSDG